jgi:ketosteroid isomerase-like protein
MSDKNEIEIRTLVENWVKAVQREDVDGAIAHHTDDIVMFDVPMPLQSKGIDAYRETWKLFFDSSSGGQESFEVAELAITASDRVAFAHGLLHIGGSKEPVGRLSMGLRKEGGEWQIAHEHHSYPADL